MWFTAAWIPASERVWNNEALITSLICLRVCVCVIRLEEKRAELERRGMRLSQIHSVGEPLRLGQLQGNHFDLVVRDLRPHGAGDTHCPGTNPHARLAALIKEAVENVEVTSMFFLVPKHSVQIRDIHVYFATYEPINRFKRSYIMQNSLKPVLSNNISSSKDKNICCSFWGFKGFRE